MPDITNITDTARSGHSPVRPTNTTIQGGASTDVTQAMKPGKRRSNWGRKRRSPNHGFTALLSARQSEGTSPREDERKRAEDGRDTLDTPDGEQGARADAHMSTTPGADAWAIGWEGEETSEDDDEDPDDDPEGGDDGEHAP